MPSLDEIMSAREPAPVEQAAPAISDAERAANPIGASRAERDEQGRFARQQDDRTEPQQADGDAGDQQQRRPGTVPQQALQAERQKRQDRDDALATLQRRYDDLERRISAPAPVAQPAPEPPKAPEVWEDPNAWREHGIRQAVEPIQQTVARQQETISKLMATQEHGREAVSAAEEAAQALFGTPEGKILAQRMGQSGDIYGELVRWHKQTRTVKEIGDDPEAYFQRRLAEWQASQDGSAAPEQQPAARAAPVLPASFAGARSGAPRGGAGYGGPRPLSEIMPRG